jgi:hypothetical protein
MNEARFVELLGAYGAELSRWPEEDRTAAETFLVSAPHRLKDIWESERVFDHLLALEKDGPASIALETKVLSSALERPRVAQPAQLFGRLSFPKWATGGAIAASLALGFAVGYAGESSTSAETDYAQMLNLTGNGAGAVFLAVMNDTEN